MADRDRDRASSPPPPSAWLVRRAYSPARDSVRSRPPFRRRPASSSAGWRAAGRAAQNRNRWYGSPCILLRQNARQGARPACAGLPIQNYRTRPSSPVGNCQPPTRRWAGRDSGSDSTTNGSAPGNRNRPGCRRYRPDGRDRSAATSHRRPTPLRISGPAWVNPYLLGRQ